MCPDRLLVVLMSVSAALLPDPATTQQPDDTKLDTAGLLTKYGYPVGKHYVTTDDGYILGVFRVPYSPKSPASRKVKTPVLLHHGLDGSSVGWVLSGPGKAFAYLLADAGYDLWLGNARGNIYSRNHTTLDPNKSRFWQFSWHEVGVHDLPSVIDYILLTTGQSSLIYIGYSMGTTVFYVMASQKPEYNTKIRAMFSLAPIAFMNHLFSPFYRFLAKFEGPAEVLTDLLGTDEYSPSDRLLQMACADVTFPQPICPNLQFILYGYSPEEYNQSMAAVFLAHGRQGSSVKEVLHYAQEIKSGHFRQYDHGPVLNLVEYGSLFPPDYNLTRITTPVALYYSVADWVSAVQDVRRLYAHLPNRIGIFRVLEDTFGHLDYIGGIHAKELVYDRVIRLMALH